MPIIPDSRITNIKKLNDTNDLYDKYCSEIKNMQIDDLTNDETWHYIESNTENNKNLLKKLDKLSLLKNENHICDCGLGLGKTLFDIYLSSKKINKKFFFYGIEKEEHYISLFESNLKKYWNNITLYKEDIMNHNYSNYNIVYTYTPFKELNNLKMFYEKIINEIKDGSILIEHIENGKGMENCLYNLVKENPNLHEINVNGNLIIYKEEL